MNEKDKKDTKDKEDMLTIDDSTLDREWEDLLRRIEEERKQKKKGVK